MFLALFGAWWIVPAIFARCFAGLARAVEGCWFAHDVSPGPEKRMSCKGFGTYCPVRLGIQLKSTDLGECFLQLSVESLTDQLN